MRPVWALALGVCLAFAACNRDDANSHLERARAALYANKPDVALSEYKLALDVLERETSSQAQLYRARALRGAADTYYLRLGDSKRAVEVYRELIRSCPEAPETLDGRLHLADVLQNNFRDLRGAIAELTAAQTRNPPQGARIAYRIASAYFELQDYEQCAIEAGNMATKYEASELVDDALFLRGQALSMMEGRKGDAQRAFTDVLDRFPDSEVRPHVLFELGRIKADQGDGEGAIELWVKSLKGHTQPQSVQEAISLVRARLRQTTPQKVGDATTAFDRQVVVRAPVETAAAEPVHKTSAEAVGGTAEEAAREAKMSPELQPDRNAPAKAAPVNKEPAPVDAAPLAP